MYIRNWAMALLGAFLLGGCATKSTTASLTIPPEPRYHALERGFVQCVHTKETQLNAQELMDFCISRMDLSKLMKNAAMLNAYKDQLKELLRSLITEE